MNVVMVKRPNKSWRHPMFKQRLLTSLVLIPLVLCILYFGNGWILGAVVLMLVAGLSWEWSQLIPMNRKSYKIIFVLGILFLILLNIQWQFSALIINAIVWLLIFVAILTYPASQSLWGYSVVVGLLCSLILPLFASTLSVLYQSMHGRDLLLYLLCLVWATDIGAYLAGKKFGRHKLISQVSPGKTIEGVSGGLAFALLVAAIGSYYFKPANVWFWYGIALYTVVISIIGDLFISMLKRRCQLKDTGQIFPGHGGVLDRLDSLIAVLPFFYWGIQGLVLRM